MTYQVLVPFTLDREYYKGETITSEKLGGFETLFVENNSLKAVTENAESESKTDTLNLKAKK